MAPNPSRKRWVAIVAVHVAFVAAQGIVAGATGLGLPITVAGLVGSAVMLVGLYVQRNRVVVGSRTILAGSIPTLFTITGVLVFAYGYSTANLVFAETAAEDPERLSRRRIDAFGQRWWAWLLGAIALLTIAYVGVAAANVFVWSLAFPAGGVSAFIGIGILSRTSSERSPEMAAANDPASTTTHTFVDRWWLLSAAFIASVFAVVSLIDVLEAGGSPVVERIADVALLIVAGAAIVAGLASRAHLPRVGGALVVVGALPGAAAILLFWHPGFVLFGFLSIAVIVKALGDIRVNEQAVPMPG